MVSWFLTFVMILPLIATITQAAVVNFLSPLPGQANTGRYVEVAVSFNTQSDLAITKLELWIDGKIFAKKNLSKPESRGVCSFQWDTAGYVNGSHFLLVKMFAGNREIASISGAGSVGASNSDIIPPLVKITNIKPGSSIKGIQTIKLSALDNSGQSPLVSLLVDQKLKLLKNTPPYIYDLDTTSYDDGKHEIQTYAFDTEGNKSDVVTLDVVFANGRIASASVDAPAEVIDRVATVPNTVVPNQVVIESEPAARATESVAPVTLNNSRIAVSATAPGQIIQTTVKPVVKTVASAPKPVVKSEVTITPVAPKVVAVKPIEPVKIAAAPTVKVTPPAPIVVASQPVESVKTVEVPMNIQIAPAKPVINEPIVVAKLETIERPSARMSDSLKSVTAVRNPVRVRVEHPLVMASSRIAVPAIPAYVKPIPVRVSKIVQPKSALTAVKPAVNTPVVAVVHKTVVKTHVAVVPVKTATVIAVQPKPAAIPKVVVPVPVKREVVSNVKTSQKLVAQKMMLPEKPLRVMETPSPAPRMVKLQVQKPVRMAMAPTVMKQNFKREILVKPTRAAYDVRATELPKSGKMKLRDLVKSMDGVVLWDSKTRTVTAYVKNMKLELSINNGLVRVNGKSMKVNLVPYISKGRTIIDVRLYDKACMVAGMKQHVASTKQTK